MSDVLNGREKPRCPDCGGEMECVLTGGKELDDAGKWVASGRESWRCLDAAGAYEAARRAALEQVWAEFHHHARYIPYERERVA